MKNQVFEDHSCCARKKTSSNTTMIFIVIIVGYKLLQNCSSWGYKQNNYIFGHRKICLTRPDIFTFENQKKIFFWHSQALLGLVIPW